MLSLENIVNKPVLAKQEKNASIKKPSSFLKILAWGTVFGLATLVGCSGKPRLRFGFYPTSTIGTTFLDPNNLGEHGYRFKLSEKNGIIYTCKAGHIDLVHVRIAADWTAYLVYECFKRLMKNDVKFSYRFKPDISRYFVHITYPNNWEDLPYDDKEKIARNVSLKMGQYLAFNTTTWHEILTWFDYKCMGFFPEFPSAFSWEDSFSNLLGTRLAVKALQDNEHTYDEAMILAINQELKNPDAQPAKVANEASKKVKGKWFSGEILYGVNMIRRNFDIGLDDAHVEPTLVPYVPKCEGVERIKYPVPSLDSLCEYGFFLEFKIKAREFEKDKIFAVLNPDRTKIIDVEKHFPKIMAFIEDEAVNKYGYYISAPFSR